MDNTPLAISGFEMQSLNATRRGAGLPRDWSDDAKRGRTARAVTSGRWSRVRSGRLRGGPVGAP
ncbi:hypothetical protein [Streptomyces sp. CB03911]|uniref:hypothetical protein n=1 Tax=Streptomycetaceae TaxID=2062 RepID=UPI0018FEF67F|nr:hypothetical protein [Streptomyces sp. CB03911]